MPPNSSETSAKTFGTCSWSFTSSEATATDYAGMPLEQLGLQLVEPVDPAGAQRKVAPFGGERASHAFTEARSWRR